MYFDLKKHLFLSQFYKKTDKSLYACANTGNPQAVMRSEIKTLISFYCRDTSFFLWYKIVPDTNPL